MAVNDITNNILLVWRGVQPRLFDACENSLDLVFSSVQIALRTGAWRDSRAEITVEAWEILIRSYLSKYTTFIRCFYSILTYTTSSTIK